MSAPGVGWAGVGVGQRVRRFFLAQRVVGVTLEGTGGGCGSSLPGGCSRVETQVAQDQTTPWRETLDGPDELVFERGVADYLRPEGWS